jgi:DNA-binding NtrC family response regulator
VRELRNAMQHASLVARGGIVLPLHLPFAGKVAAAHPPVAAADQGLARYLDSLDFSPGEAMAQAVHPVEREMVARALDKFGGNRSAAAAYLGVHRNTLRNKLRGETAAGGGKRHIHSPGTGAADAHD